MPSTASETRGHFLAQFNKLFENAREEFLMRQDPGRGPKPKLPAWDLVSALVYHVLNGAGILSQHVYELLGVNIKDSSLSERRQRIGFEPFAWLANNALRPLADERIDSSAFYKGLRLCGIDGSRWSVTNTPQVAAEMTKAVSRRFKAAFAKVQMCVLVELGLHNPLAAAVGLKEESEWSLAEQLLACLPQSSLLIVDRLYGCGKYMRELMAACQARASHLLVRARGNVISRMIESLHDGSRLVSIRLPGGGKDQAARITVREIAGRIRKPGCRQWSEVRIWTTLLDARKYPAMELLKLYGFRWEQEIFYKELKINLRGGAVLHSHTPETAAQEVAALLLACSLLAEQRLAAARDGSINPLNISFIKTLEGLRALWAILAVADGLLDEQTSHALYLRIRESILRQATPPRRKRSCPRKVRQPVKSWPRLISNDSLEGDYEFEIISFP
jgi:hypothetical protein